MLDVAFSGTRWELQFRIDPSGGVTFQGPLTYDLWLTKSLCATDQPWKGAHIRRTEKQKTGDGIVRRGLVVCIPSSTSVF